MRPRWSPRAAPVAVALLPAALLIVGGVGVAAGAQVEGDEAARALLASAADQQVRDLAAWRDFRFVRLVERERLSRQGRPLEVVRWRFRVEPHGEGFEETLLSADGRAPTAREVEQHRRAGRFAEHYRGVLTGRAEQVDEGYALTDLLSLPSYRYAGEESVDGVPCLRFDFEPALDAPGGFAGRLARVSEGSLWLSATGGHLVRAVARTVGGVRFAGGLVRIPRLAVEYRGARVEGEAWLPVEIRLESEISVFGNATVRRNRYVYSEHERVRPAASSR